MYENVLRRVQEILEKIPNPPPNNMPPLTDEELAQTVAAELIRGLTVPENMVKDQEDLVDRMDEFGVYLGGFLHPEIL